jgi:hypothetical protein
VLSSPERLARTILALCAAQASCCSRLSQSVMQAHIEITERHLDSVRTVLATSIVDTRRWLSASEAATAPAAPSRYPFHGGLAPAAPIGAGPPVLPQAGPATRC